MALAATGGVLEGAHAQSGDGFERPGGVGEVLPLLRRRTPLPADGAGPLRHHPEQVLAAVDENTIGVVAILGTTYTGELEPIAEICAALDKLAAGGGVDVPVHVDAASGGFVVPFCIRTWYGIFGCPAWCRSTSAATSMG